MSGVLGGWAGFADISRAALAVLSGLLSGCAALAVAELVSAAVRPEAGPVTAVGGAAIDRTPAGVKDFGQPPPRSTAAPRPGRRTRLRPGG